MRAWSDYLPFFGTASAVVLVDQVTKALVLAYIPLHEGFAVIPGFFNLAHVRNPGGAFSFLAGGDSPMRHYLFLAAGVVALGLILYFYSQTPATHRFLKLGLALIFGGAIGNMIDRLRFNEVVDFLDFYVGKAHWPTFNIADSGVTVGVVIFLLHIVFKKLPF